MKPTKVWVSEDFKKMLKVNAANENKSIIEYSDDLAKSMKGIQVTDENNKKRFRFL